LLRFKGKWTRDALKYETVGYNKPLGKERSHRTVPRIPIKIFDSFVKKLKLS
jgi:hypothetical protein